MSESFLQDYVMITQQMDFKVDKLDASKGKALYAGRSFEPGEELLEELPVVCWPHPSNITSDGDIQHRGQRQAVDGQPDACICDACLSVFHMERRVACPQAQCSGSFCSEACATSLAHGVFCKDVLRQVRRWQAQNSRESTIGAESIARCLVRVAELASGYKQAFNLDAETALANAWRPFERLCSFPPGFRLELQGSTMDVLSDSLMQLLSPSYCGALQSVFGNEGLVLASRLLQKPFIENLYERLSLNALQYEHGPWSMAGVCILCACANHSCVPNAEVVARMSEDDSASMNEDTKAALILRTTRRIALGEELVISYVPVEWDLQRRKNQLQHWAFDCNCDRCAAQTAAIDSRNMQQQHQEEWRRLTEQHAQCGIMAREAKRKREHDSDV